MQLARVVGTLGLLLVFGLSGFGGGYGPGSPVPLDREESNQIKESKKTAHSRLNDGAKKIKEDLEKQGAMRRGAHRRR
jgi:hypothetical protein